MPVNDQPESMASTSSYMLEPGNGTATGEIPDDRAADIAAPAGSGVYAGEKGPQLHQHGNPTSAASSLQFGVGTQPAMALPPLCALGTSGPEQLSDTGTGPSAELAPSGAGLGAVAAAPGALTANGAAFVAVPAAQQGVALPIQDNMGNLLVRRAHDCS